MHAEILVIRFINLHSYKHEKANIDQSNFTLRLQIKQKKIVFCFDRERCV